MCKLSVCFKVHRPTWCKQPAKYNIYLKNKLLNTYKWVRHSKNSHSFTRKNSYFLCLKNIWRTCVCWPSWIEPSGLCIHTSCDCIPNRRSEKITPRPSLTCWTGNGPPSRAFRYLLPLASYSEIAPKVEYHIMFSIWFSPKRNFKIRSELSKMSNKVMLNTRMYLEKHKLILCEGPNQV